MWYIMQKKHNTNDFVLLRMSEKQVGRMLLNKKKIFKEIRRKVQLEWAKITMDMTERKKSGFICGN